MKFSGCHFCPGHGLEGGGGGELSKQGSHEAVALKFPDY